MENLIQSLGKEPEIALGFVLGSLGIIALAAIVITSVIVTQWRQVRQTEEMNALKQSLLDRGMSAEEIAQVVNAGRRGGVPIHAGKHGMHACG